MRDCEKEYLGQTKRQFDARFKQGGISFGRDVCGAKIRLHRLIDSRVITIDNRYGVLI